MSADPCRLMPVHGLSGDPADRARFDAWAQVFAVAGRFDADEVPFTAEEMRVGERDPANRRVRLAAVEMAAGAEAVRGAVNLVVPLKDNLHFAEFELVVAPEHRRRGIGRQLLEAVEALAQHHGRRTLVTETSWRGGTPTDDPASGDAASGDPASVDPAGHFARRFGYAPAQTVRRSDYAVPQQDPVVPPPPQGYLVQTHVGTPPAVDLVDRAWLARRMTTDAPLGDIDREEEDWDEDRVRALDARLETMGRGRVSAFARHRGSGRLVAFSEIQVPEESPELAYHQDTLVLREHRGHGLGLALKLANVVALRTAFPQVRTVRTWNAVENAHMLAVNAAMGYVTTGYLREWQKRL